MASLKGRVYIFVSTALWPQYWYKTLIVFICPTNPPSETQRTPLSSSNSSNIKINVTRSHQLSTVYLFGITSLRLTWERIKNRLYIHNFFLISQLFLYILCSSTPQSHITIPETGLKLVLFEKMSYLSATMNLASFLCRQDPLLEKKFLLMFKGCGKPRWSHCPLQLSGNSQPLSFDATFNSVETSYLK